MKSPHSGYSLVELVISLSIASITSLLIGTVALNSINTRRNFQIVNAEIDLESRYRTLLMSSPALINTRAASANSVFNQCLISGQNCPNPSAELELWNTRNERAVPLASLNLLIDNSGKIGCNGNNIDCQWQVSATYAPLCSPSPCTSRPQVIDFTVTLDWKKPASFKGSFFRKTKKIHVSVSTNDILAPAGSLMCQPNEILQGINSSGAPICLQLPDCDPGQFLFGYDPTSKTWICDFIPATFLPAIDCPAATKWFKGFNGSGLKCEAS
jgi:type II secretory pathway pseudopilin PulG